MRLFNIDAGGDGKQLEDIAVSEVLAAANENGSYITFYIAPYDWLF